MKEGCTYCTNSSERREKKSDHRGTDLVWMVDESELAKGFLDIFCRCFPLDAKDLVMVPRPANVCASTPASSARPAAAAAAAAAAARAGTARARARGRARAARGALLLRSRVAALR